MSHRKDLGKGGEGKGYTWDFDVHKVLSKDNDCPCTGKKVSGGKRRAYITHLSCVRGGHL